MGIVRAHHMFSIGMDTDSKCYFAAATIVIGIPTGVKIFSWVGHFCTGGVELTVTVIWGVLFLWLFTAGGVTRTRTPTTIKEKITITKVLVTVFLYVESNSKNTTTKFK